ARLNRTDHEAAIKMRQVEPPPVMSNCVTGNQLRLPRQRSRDRSDELRQQLRLSVSEFRQRRISRSPFHRSAAGIEGIIHRLGMANKIELHTGHGSYQKFGAGERIS